MFPKINSHMTTPQTKTIDLVKHYIQLFIKNPTTNFHYPKRTNQTHTLLLWRNNLLFCCGQLLFKQIILRKTNKNEWEHNASASAYCKVNKLLIEFYEMIFRFVLFYCTIFKPEEKMVNIMKKMREKMKGNLCKIKMI